MVDLLRPASRRSPQTGLGEVAQQTEPTSWELFSSLMPLAVVFARTVTMVAVCPCWPNSKAQAVNRSSCRRGWVLFEYHIDRTVGRDRALKCKRLLLSRRKNTTLVTCVADNGPGSRYLIHDECKGRGCLDFPPPGGHGIPGPHPCDYADVILSQRRRFGAHVD